MRVRDHPSPNHDARPGDVAGGGVDMLVLHYTGMPSGRAALERLCDPAAGVSAHYLVEEDGTVLRLVDEGRRARHAGVSHWRGRKALNATSIGVEIVNPGHQWGYRPFPALQMGAVAELCLGILARHRIPARNVVAHSDIAPDRKQDPGELFDWQGLAALGIGLWPREGAEPDADAPALLERIGYRADVPLPRLVAAFQRHWRPERVDGVADAPTLARMAGLLAAIEA